MPEALNQRFMTDLGELWLMIPKSTFKSIKSMLEPVNCAKNIDPCGNFTFGQKHAATSASYESLERKLSHLLTTRVNHDLTNPRN